MTDEEKQIEEIARVICDGCPVCNHVMCHECYTAKKIYDAGYRKQAEGEWDDSIIGFCNVCLSCGAIVERAAIKNNSGKLNFCPNCGAKMKGGAE